MALVREQIENRTIDAILDNRVKITDETNADVSTDNPFAVRAGDSPSVDAFGRWRTSGTGQRFDVEFIYGKQPNLFDEVTAGSGTATHDSTARDVVLAVGDTTNGTEASIHQHWHNPYTPGNSQLIDMTGTLDGAAIGGGSASIFLKDGITGTETEIDQTNWNGDTVADVDWSTSQIFSVDFQSLKVGRLRFNLIRNGEPVLLHEIFNDNQRAKGFWQYPSLPITWRIYNDGGETISEMGYFDHGNGFGVRYRMTANASASLRAICATVKSEGGKDLFDMPGFKRSVDMGVTTKTVSTTLVPLLTIRPATTFNSIMNFALGIPDFYTVQTDNGIRLALIKNGNLTGASFAAVNATQSMMEYDVTASAISGGIVLDSDYIGTGTANRTTAREGFLGRSVLAYGMNGVQDTLSICAVRTAASNAAVLAGIEWREIT